MISQREAQRLKKRVAELETIQYDQRYRWTKDWQGVNIAEINLGHDLRTLGRIEGARMAGHAIVLTLSSDGGRVRVQALRLPEQT